MSYLHNVSSASYIAPHDTNNLAGGTTIGIYVGTGGNLRCRLKDGKIIMFTSLASGVIHPIAVQQVFSTGTTASNLLAVY